MPGERPHCAGKASSGPRRDSSADARRLLLSRAARFHLLPIILAGVALSVSSIEPVWAASSLISPALTTGDVIQLAVFIGVMGAALISAVATIRERARVSAENVELRSRIADLNATLQRSEALLNLRDQRLIVWASDRQKVDLIGALPSETGAPDERSSFLAFGRWLLPRSAAALDHAVIALRERAIPFDITVETTTGLPLEVQGRKTSSHVIVRFTSLSENLRAQARLKLENQRLVTDHEIMLGLIDALKMPFWLRSADGRLKWVNRAFADAVDMASVDDVVRNSREFLGTMVRETISAHHQSNRVFDQTVSTVVSGDRRVFSVTDVASGEGSAGIASDISNMQAVQEEYENAARSHAETLDRLTTAVAIFDSKEKLRFFNQAFQKLWDLDISFLESAPDNALLLDRLRSDGKIAEQPEWRRWKETLLEAYRAVESQEHWWHLPDGRTVRVVANPQANGGVTWVFENVTERMNLESRYNSIVRVQGETLDNLAEGVAVFGPDGRIRLANPAFANLWKLPQDVVAQNMHISAIKAWCDGLSITSPWREFVSAVTGFDDERRDRHGQAELKSGIVLRYAVIHLPNGQVMMTFVDVTDSVKVERALVEKNEALQRADQLKNDFVQHVSYELRSPLTNIIGFTELLSLPSTGPLEPRQREYVGHIGSSSAVLLTIVNDILDLATVDAGIMQLEISEVSIAQTVAAAAELIAERLQEHSIKLDVDTRLAPFSFQGDETRVRQVLYNLLSNAANYAPECSTIKLVCRIAEAGVEFAVHDDGPGIPQTSSTPCSAALSRGSMADATAGRASAFLW